MAIVDALREGERCVRDLQEIVGVSQSLLSHHLRTLRDVGVVSDRKQHLVAVDTLFLGTLKGAGKIYQGVLDCFSRYTRGRLYTSNLPLTAVQVINPGSRSGNVGRPRGSIAIRACRLSWEIAIFVSSAPGSANTIAMNR